MKKTLLSVLVGFAVIGSAIAAPSPEDRKALCEKHPEKYVWVEKDQFCAPIDPCALNTDAQINATYCAGVISGDLGVRDLLINRYVEQVMGTSVQEIKELKNTNNVVSTIGVKTKDGNYFSVVYAYDVDVYEYGDAIRNAFWAYGLYYEVERLGGDATKIVANAMKKESRLCQDIKDFASLLAGDTVIQDYNVDGCAFYLNKK